MPQENKNSEPTKRDDANSLADGPTMGLRDADPTDGPYRLARCPACGRRFGKRPVLTLAIWFTFGSPRREDIVHYSCRFTRAPINVRREYRRQRRLEAWRVAAARREASAARRRGRAVAVAVEGDG